MKSSRKKLNKREILKSLHIAFWSGVITFFTQSVFLNFSEIHWQSVVLAGVTPMALYLRKTFFEDNK
jgi:membrane protein implicated in regulation of membrane protease activity